MGDYCKSVAEADDGGAWYAMQDYRYFRDVVQSFLKKFYRGLFCRFNQPDGECGVRRQL